MIVTILYRQAGQADINGLDNPFDDVAAGQWYTDAIKQTLYKLGIINGVGINANGQTIINPKAITTRAQVAAMLHRFIMVIK
jgi:hypothetical protein